MMLWRKLIDFWNSPCREGDPFRPYHTMAISSLLVVAALFVVAPWGKDVPLGWGVLLAVACGALTLLAEAVHYFLLPKLFPAWYDRDKWTQGNEITSTVAMLFTVAVFCYLFFVIAFHMPLTWSVLLSFLLYFLAIVPLPIGIINMWKQNRRLTRNLREANEMNELLLKRIGCQPDTSTTLAEAPQMMTVADGRAADFSISLERFLYAQANGNYVNVAYLEGSGVAKRMLRVTLKSLEQDYSGDGWVVRCHRAYLVNARRIRMVTGNAQECLLHLEGCSEPVPVSRGCRSEVMKYVS